MGKSVNMPGLGHKAPIPNGARVGSLFFSSGINGKDPGTGKAPDDIRDEVRLAFENLAALLREAGGRPEDVASMTVFLKNRDDKKHVDEQWLSMFPDPADRPARHAVRGDGPMRIQLQVVAVLGEGTGAT
jgi:2-iminobutanoate/2-iminopropanoate deaminase